VETVAAQVGERRTFLQQLAPDHFRDPIAAQLLTPDERRAVDRARDDTPPASGRERLAWERLRACAEGMVPQL